MPAPRITSLIPDSPDGLSRQDQRPRKRWQNCRFLLSPVGSVRTRLPEPGLSRDWGSCHDGCWRMRILGGLEALPEAGAERAVVDGAADLEQPIGTAPRPAHLLRFVHATIDEEVGCSLGQRRANPQPGPVPFAVVDQPIALPDEVAVQRLQRSPQLARGRDGSAAAGLATEVMHHRADAIDT